MHLLGTANVEVVPVATGADALRQLEDTSFEQVVMQRRTVRTRSCWEGRWEEREASLPLLWTAAICRERLNARQPTELSALTRAYDLELVHDDRGRIAVEGTDYEALSVGD